MKIDLLKFKTGFTLIEMLVGVAIMGILAAFAYPSYTKYVQRTHRADAIRALLEMRQAMERGYSTSYDYGKAYTGTAGAFDSEPNATFYPTANLPIEYKFNGAGTATTYTLTAEPKSSSSQKDDECATLKIDQSGVKTVAKSTDPATVQKCW